MVAEQYKILRAVIPLLRLLQKRGQVELTVTPFFQPILPLLVDSDAAVLDRPGTVLPSRFAWPADALCQVESALRDYRERFGRPAHGIWPAEGAVSADTIRLLGENGVEWVATDQGVLQRSGRFGYQVERPEVLHQPYRLASCPGGPAVFFRTAELSDRIGFRFQHLADAGAAARELVTDLKQQFRMEGAGAPAPDPVVTLVSDGENPWGRSLPGGTPFLRALYGLLAEDGSIGTVTPREYLSGNAGRGSAAPGRGVVPVHDLADTGPGSMSPGRHPAWTSGPGSGKTRRTVPGNCWEPPALPSRQRGRVKVRRRMHGGRCWRSKGATGTGGLATIRTAGRTRSGMISFGVISGSPTAGLVFRYQPSWMTPLSRASGCSRSPIPSRRSWRATGSPSGPTAPGVSIGGSTTAKRKGQVRLPVCAVRGGPLRYQAILGPFPPDAHRLGLHFHCEHLGCDGLGGVLP